MARKKTHEEFIEELRKVNPYIEVMRLIMGKITKI